MTEEEATKKGESKEMKEYFDKIYSDVLRGYDVANEARSKGYDPEEKVDSPLAANMIERVEGLISSVAPQLVGSGMSERLFELEKEFGILDWRVSLVIAEEVANEKFCKFKNVTEAIEVGIRTGFTYHTLGIVSAPLEGFASIEIKKRKDGREYFVINFASPIRAAGGTGASVCVIIADYVRKKLGYAEYDPDENEVKRFNTELNDYHDRVTNLQYHPSEDETNFLAAHIPIQISGDPSEKLDVSNYKDLERVPTNKIRGGMCLVFSMIALKAPKLWKRLDKWGNDFELDWDFLKDFLKIQKEIKSGGNKNKEASNEEKPKITPNKTFIADLPAGRPVLTYPMAFGGFRLRYGRCRTSGYSAAAIHPATMEILDDFIAIGTQLKLERPGKAASMTSCDFIEGPIVKLNNGNVIRLNTSEKAKEVKKEIDKILFLGDILLNFGDFSENNHNLVPSGYCEEWWLLELKKKARELMKTNLEDLSTFLNIDEEKLDKIMKNCFQEHPTFLESFSISKKLDIPLHPVYTYHWKGIMKEDLLNFLEALEKSNIEINNASKIIIPYLEEIKLIIEKIGLPHKFTNNEFIVIELNDASALYFSLGLNQNTISETIEKITSSQEKEVLKLLNLISDFEIRDKSGTWIGARMGRPEKAKMRFMKGKPHGLFPTGVEGDRLKCFQSALLKNKITTNFAIFYCDNCKKETIYSVCENCKTKTRKKYYCKICKELDNDKCEHGEAQRFKRQSIDIPYYFQKALQQLNTNVYPDLIKGPKDTTNKNHVPEHLIKAILRAKYDLTVNKDGSVRFDMSELPITHFKPSEIGTSVEKLIELGYFKDMDGKPLETDDQILEIKPQDIILPGFKSGLDDPASDVLFRVAQFVDELLEKLYGLKKFYKLKSKEDLAGQLVLGLAPHISAAMVGRIIGFSKTAGCYAHPMWHAALRRDCDGDEASVSLLLDSLVNFSRQYLPDRLGARTMDAPLVLTAKLVPSEVDDMIQGMDVVDKYSLNFYESALNYKAPGEVEEKPEQFGERLDTPGQYEGMKYTLPISDINQGVLCSAYKTIPSMQEKIDGQMHIAEMINAVNTTGVAELVINKHLLKDIKGNLRKFSMQQFRCVSCNEKYRRIPLTGKCKKCKGKVIFTIHQGSVIKYLEPSLSLAKKYTINNYLQQTLDILKERIDIVFGREKEKQEALKKWF